MRTIGFLVGFTLAVLLLRCSSDATSGRQDVHVHEKSRAPICTYDAEIGTIDLNGELLSETLELAIPKGASSAPYHLFAVPYSADGDELTDKHLLWEAWDDTLVTFTSHAWNDSTVDVSMLRDWFDEQGNEPASDARVCVKDSCSNCTDFQLVGLIDVSGTWCITSAQFPFTFELNILQRGRELTSALNSDDGIIATLQGNHVIFTHASLRYECTLKTRTFCAGNTTDLQTGAMLARWNAVRQ